MVAALGSAAIEVRPSAVFAAVTAVFAVAVRSLGRRLGLAELGGPGRDPRAGLPTVVVLVIGAYVLDAIAFVPHTAYLSDFVGNELRLGTQAGTLLFAVLGAGAVVGGWAASTLAHRWGSARALTICYAVKATATAAAAATATLGGLAISAGLVGAMIPAVVSLTFVRLSECVSPARAAQLWASATVLFALGQAASGIVMGIGYATFVTYRPLFAVGGAVLVVAMSAAALAERRQT